MRSLIILTLAAGLPIAAHAQITGAVGATTGVTAGAVGAGAGVGATVGADTNVTGATAGAASDATGTTASSVHREMRNPGPEFERMRKPRPETSRTRVNGGPSVHVTRETRCYDGADYYDPYYGDGYYYCQTSGPTVSAKVGNDKF